MRNKLSKAFSESLARIKKGEPIQDCLAAYHPELRQQLVPLLYTALALPAVPRAAPSADFKEQSKARLLARLCPRSFQAGAARWLEAFAGGLAGLWWGVSRAFTGPARIAVPVALVLVLALQGLFLFGALNFISSPAPALASQFTLSTRSGGVQAQVPGSDTWTEAPDGMMLQAGSRVKTAPDAQAVLTFFNGTTVTLEPGTDLVVQRLEGGGENKPTVILLQQWLGKTWSRVEKLADPGSRYEIETPSATALVRGTVFVTEVDSAGGTRVETFEGLVSVRAQDREVYLPPGQQTTVKPGAAPADPAPAGGDNQPAAATDGAAAGAAPAQVSAGEGSADGNLAEPLPWEDEYQTWLLVLVIGALVLSLGVTVYMWLRQR